MKKNKTCKTCGGFTMKFLVYAKHKDDKKYRAMDISKGKQVTNLIKATQWPLARLPDLGDHVKMLNEDNPDWDFEIRRKG